jgi:REP element-mobilizing transposase RayT
MTTGGRYDPERHRRRSTRFKGWDYAGPGRYFVTLCTADRELLFGDVVDGSVVLSAAGQVAVATWRETPVVHPSVTLDAFVVMPNHLHGILSIRPDGWQRGAEESDGRPHGPSSGSLGAIVGVYEATATKRIRALPGWEGAVVWQRGFHDRIIRDDAELARARAYIHANPANWPYDAEHPQNRRR